MLSQLLGENQACHELLTGARLPTLSEATLLGAYFNVDPRILRLEKQPSLGVSLRLGRVDGLHDVTTAVEHATRLLSVDRLTREWGFKEATENLSSFSPSKTWHDRQAGEITANRLRNFLDMDPIEPVVDLTEFVESLGYAVEYRPLPSDVHGISVPEEWDGFTAWIILINSEDGWGRQRFTLAHELCHVLQRDAGHVIVDRATVDDRRAERIADSFARHFLLTNESVDNALKSYGHVDSWKQAAELISSLMLNYGISRDATLIALRESQDQRVTESALDSCSQVPVSTIMRESGRIHDWMEMNQTRGVSFPSARLTTQALDAYSKGLISLQSVADVISNGDTLHAANQLREAGWEDFAGV